MLDPTAPPPVTIVIPACNEEHALAAVVADVRDHLDAAGFAPEIIVVDDGSTERTAAAAFATGARVLQHRNTRGYGAALKTGIAAATHDIVGHACAVTLRSRNLRPPDPKESAVSPRIFHHEVVMISARPKTMKTGPLTPSPLTPSPIF